jgi:hypothetical protein
VWKRTEATLSSAEDVRHDIDVVQSKEAPPVPTVAVPEPKAGGLKVKVKPVKPASEVPSPLPSMPPPALLPVRKYTGATAEAAKPKKRSHNVGGDVDDLLGAEVDAIDQGPVRPAPVSAPLPPKKARRSPERRDSLEPASKPASKIVVPKVLPAPQLPAPPVSKPAIPPRRDQPSSATPAIPFKLKRARLLIAALTKEPSAFLVRQNP